MWIQTKELVRSMKENQVRIRLTLVAAAHVCCEAIQPNTLAVAPQPLLPELGNQGDLGAPKMSPVVTGGH